MQWGGRMLLAVLSALDDGLRPVQKLEAFV
jgi:hypothetical protein